MMYSIKLFLFFAALLGEVCGCSTIAVGRLASSDGSVFTSHSDDGEGNPDPRIVMVKAADHSAGAMRPIYPDLENFPRHIGANRSASYAPGAYPVNAHQENTQPIGFIPEVSHTYAYWDTNYAVMNEHNVHIGESTCSGVFGTLAKGKGGSALFSINELSRVALSRCTTARCAVTTMGALAVKFGFYGAGSFEGTAESLLVGDTTEVWVFHVLPDSHKGGSAIWVAQRVPDGHVTGVFNMFTIREVDLSNSAEFLGSSNMHSIAKEQGLWDGKGKLDFTKTFSDGEYAHKYYSGRRFWGAMRLVAPSLNLSATYGNLKDDNPYPWSIVPDKPLSAADVFRIHREYYAGTPYDTSQGLAAGAYGNIDRLKINQANSQLDGSWERTITLYRTTYSFVNQARPGGQAGITWYGPHAAHGTVYVPLLSSASSLPHCLTIGSPSFVDRTASWWAHRWLANQARLNFQGYLKHVQSAQAYWEGQGQQVVDRAASLNSQQVSQAMQEHADKVMAAWWKLADDLMCKFADGFLDHGEPYGYSNEYLEAVGFLDGPPPIRPKNGGLYSAHD